MAEERLAQTCCPACDAVRDERSKHALHKGAFRYAVCDDCGSGWLVASEEFDAPEFDAAGFYDHGYFNGQREAGYGDYDADGALHRRNADARLARLLRGWRPGDRPQGTPKNSGDDRRLLDVGCATGYLLEAAADRGWAPTGIELSDWAAGRARERTGAPVHGRLDDLDPSAAFDAVTFCQVLEHMPDPHGALAAARRRIAPGGRVLIETWNAHSLVARIMGRSWQQVSPPSVLHLFTRRGIEQLARRTGFRVVSFRRTSKWISLGFAATLLEQKLPGPLRPIAAVMRSVGRVPIPYWAGDLVTIVLAAREQEDGAP